MARSPPSPFIFVYQFPHNFFALTRFIHVAEAKISTKTDKQRIENQESKCKTKPESKQEENRKRKQRSNEIILTKE